METRIEFYAVVDPDTNVEDFNLDQAVGKGDAKKFGKFEFKGSHYQVVEAIRKKIDELAKQMSKPEYKEFQAIKALVTHYKYTKDEFQKEVVSRAAEEAF